MLQHSTVIFVILMFYRCQSATYDGITDTDITNAFQEAQRIMDVERENKDYETYYFDAKFDNRKSPNIAYLQKYRAELEHAKIQEVLEVATKILKHRFNLTLPDIIKLKERDLESALPDITEKCQSMFDDIVCNESYPFRTIDGSCNNILNPKWGKSFTCFNRLFPPAYSDGVSAFRKSASGGKLPDPRVVSLSVNPERNNPSQRLTTMHMQFGQLITHDMGFSPNAATRPIGFPVNCCPISNSNLAECSAFNISKSDPFYSQYNSTCHTNARTHICTRCKLGYRSQVNHRTAFIDGSVIYGITKEMNNQLRNFDGTGTLKYENHEEAGELLPQSSIPHADRCSIQNKFKNCFEGGDPELNQHTMLVALSTVFARHHNRIAKSLHSMYKDWCDEKIFQVARKIVGAQLQVITYNEYLPSFIGKTAMTKYNLFINEDLIYTEYDATKNPTLLNEFTTSAFRIGHTQIQKNVPEIYRHKIEYKSLKDTYRFPFHMYEHENMDAMIRGMTLQPSEQIDRFIATEVSQDLLKYHANATGNDLAAFDLLRERDHGIPPYVDIVKFCLGQDIRTFDDLIPLLGKENIQAYKDVYENVRDIDALTAGYAEKHMEGGDVGPTIACILGIQFNLLKFGDRFYFEHKNQVGSFTPVQLRELKKTRLSKILCDNTQFDMLPEYALSLASLNNPIKSCKDLPEVNLGLFAQ